MHFTQRVAHMLRRQMCHVHLGGIGAGIANSTLYFLHCASFGYGSKLVRDGEMKFDYVFR